MHEEPLLNFVEVEGPSYELLELQEPGVVLVLGVVPLATRWAGLVMDVTVLAWSSAFHTDFCTCASRDVR
jgi:hypothetical protein